MNIDEQVKETFSELKEMLDLFLIERPSRELLIANMKLTAIKKVMLKNEECSKQIFSAYMLEFRNLIHSLNSITKSINLIEKTIEFENLYLLKFNHIIDERRTHPRFYVYMEVEIEEDGEVHHALVSDISRCGLKIYAQKYFDEPVHCKIKTIHGEVVSTTIEPVHNCEISFEENHSKIHTMGAKFSRALDWEMLKDAIVKSFAVGVS